MGAQINYEKPLSPRVGMPGQLADTSLKDTLSRVNAGGQTAKVVEVTFQGQTDQDVYGATVAGVTFSAVSDGVETAAVAAAAIALLINADPVIYAAIEASAAGAVVTLTGRDFGNDFTVTAIGDASASVDVAASSGAVLPYGALVVADGLDGVKLPSSISDGDEVGITHRAGTVRQDAAGMAAGDVVPVLNAGRVWVRVDSVASVVQRGAVYVDPATPTLFATSSGGSKVAISRIKFTGATDEANGLAVVEIAKG